MKKWLLFLLVLLSVSAGQAQVIFTPQLPPLGLTVKPQLWSFSLINAGNTAINVKVEMVLKDASNNQTVLSGVSRIFNLPMGIKQVQLAEVLPVTYTLGVPGYGVDISQDGFLPVGTFTICYTVIKVLNDAPEQVGEECITTQVEPLSPPQLILPVDSERVEVARPFFTWLPPSPFTLFNNLRYDWVLVELLPTQSASDAVQQNIPVLSQQGLTFTNFQYPLSMPELDTSKYYAWRVTAKNNSSPIANSEAWVFKVRKFGVDTTVHRSSGYYLTLKKEEDAAATACSGILRYEFLNELNATEVELRVYDISTPNRREIVLDSVGYAVKYGQNFLQLDLTEYSAIKDRHIYLLELINARKESWYLKFEYRKPE